MRVALMPLFAHSRAPRVAVIILNWNGHQDTLPLLDSLAKSTYRSFSVVIVDNDSASDDRAALEAGLSERGECRFLDAGAWSPGPDPPLTLIRSTQNLGFAGGNNLAVRYLQETRRGEDYVWFLNNDTTVAPETLHTLVEALARDEGIGAAQSLLLRAHTPDRIDSAGIRLRRRGGAYDELSGKPAACLDRLGEDVVDIFGGCAASVLYRRRILDEIGAFDPSFFAVNEDVDLACRLRSHGYRTVLVRTSVVYHKRGVSRKRKQGYIAFVAARNKLHIVARWWPRGRGMPLLILEAARLLGRAARLDEVGVRGWLRIVPEAFRSWLRGADARTRRDILASGTRPLLSNGIPGRRRNADHSHES